MYLACVTLGGVRLSALDWPDHQEVIQTVKTHLPGLDNKDLNQAVVDGLLRHLPTRMFLISDPLKEITTPPKPCLSQTNILDQAYGYFRVDRVDKPLLESLDAALQQLHATNAFSGIVLDLRYAAGADYSTAADVASLFLDKEVSLFTFRQETVKSRPRTNAWKVPVAILVNRQTKEAAEVLAGVLRNSNVGLLIGTNTAGCAFAYQEFPLKNGQILRLATDRVSLRADSPILENGLVPDILVPVSPEDETAHYADSFRPAFKPVPATAARLGETNRTASLSGTNRGSRRLNEAELVRRQKEGGLNIDDEGDGAVRSREVEDDRTTVTDPALVRALDLLKGLAVVQKSRPAAFNR